MKNKWCSIPVFWVRILKFEYWPYAAVYIFAMLYLFWWTLRFGNKFYLFILNPSIGKDGGFSEPKKSEINNLFPKKYIPDEILFSKGDDITITLEKVTKSISFPCIIKPENLVKGIGVKKIDTLEELTSNLEKVNSDYIVQEWLAQKKEYAVFIAKKPGDSLKIIGLTAKHLLTVIGNGKNTARELLKNSLDFKMAAKHLEKFNKSLLDTVPKEGELFIIQHIGNHNKGTRFEDISYEITSKMESLFQEIVPQTGVYYGRFDVKAPQLQSLETGEGLKIIEFNGTIAEPVNYLDRNYGFFKAQKIILNHYYHQRQIAAAIIQSGVKCPGLLTGIKLALNAQTKYTHAAFTLSDEFV